MVLNPRRSSLEFLWILSQRGPTEAGSFVSGNSPSSPIKTALSVPCPIPVRASEPKSSVDKETAFSKYPCCLAFSKKSRAAFIGPTVWELEGPIPILKSSKTLTVMEIQAVLEVLVRRRSRLPAPEFNTVGGSRYLRIQLLQLLSCPSITSPPITACMTEP